LRVKLSHDWEEYGSGPYRAVDNVWGKDGLKNGVDYTQSVSLDTVTFPEGVKLEWSWPDVFKPAIYAYPEVIFGYKPWDPGVGLKDFIAPVNDLKAFTADFDLTISGSNQFDVAFDVWLTDRRAGGPSSITTEVMIWLHSGRLTPAGHSVASYHGDGYSASIWHEKSMGDASGDSSASWQYIALRPDHDFLTGKIDIRDILNTLREEGLISGKDYVSGFELGAEVAGGAGSLTINGLHPTFAKYGVTSHGDTITGTAENDRVDGGKGDDHLAGGDGSDRLIGGSGKDLLAGDAGSDRLSGGGGRDVFVFDSALGADNVDRITDFTDRDTIRLSHLIFAAVGATLEATEFRAGTHSTDSDDRIIYDRATGALSYDPDGTGGAAEVEFAVLAKGLKLGHADFIVV
jgi:Ca2+-binding RTX toxin-like protein